MARGIVIEGDGDCIVQGNVVNGCDEGIVLRNTGSKNVSSNEVSHRPPAVNSGRVKSFLDGVSQSAIATILIAPFVG